MSQKIVISILTDEAFASFGDVLHAKGAPDYLINDGRCGRYHDLARLDFGKFGRANISLFQSAACRLPLTLEKVERHPLGSQAFLPTSPDPFLVVVATDDGGKPSTPQAFMTSPGQGVNYLRGTWHGVLTPVRPSAFFVVDRIGDGSNLEEYRFETPYTIMEQ